MKCKKFVSLILVIALMATLFVGVPSLSASALTFCTFTVENATATIGMDSTVTVTIYADYEDVSDYSFNWNYNTADLKLLSCTQDPGYGLGAMVMGGPTGSVAGVCMTNQKYSGPILTAVFEILPGATAVRYPIGLSNSLAHTITQVIVYPAVVPGSITLSNAVTQDWTAYDTAYTALNDAYTNPTEKAKYTAASYADFEDDASAFLTSGALVRTDTAIPQGTIDAAASEMNRILGLLVPRVAATGLTLNKSSAKIALGAVDQLEAIFTPSTTTDTAVWSTSDSSIATVDANGLVLAKAVGSVTITATNSDDPSMTASCAVECVIPLSGISLGIGSADLNPGQTADLGGSVTYYPADATDKGITWTSSDPSVATVDANGVVTAVGNGTTTITGVSDDGGFEVSCTITVTTPVTGVTLPATAKVAIGGSLTLTATVLPATASNKAVTWKSSDTSIATISASGVVTGKKTGKITITVTTVDGNKTATCVVTVGVPATGITVPTGTTDITLGETVQIPYTIAPSNSTEKPVFSSSDPSIASVDANGKVTGKKVGTVTITVKIGSITKTFKVTVHNYVTMRIGYTKAIHNGTKTTVDDEGTKPFLVGIRTMVPLRFVGTRMGGKVKYISDSDPITLTYNGITVDIKLNSNKMTIIDANGKKSTVTIDVAAQKRGGRTYIPLRAISQALGFSVYYDDATQLVVVNNPAMNVALRTARLAEAKPYIK